MYLLWSNKHNMWWRSDSAGYTENVDEAGRYTREEAMEIVAQSADHGIVARVTCMVRDTAFGEMEWDDKPEPASAAAPPPVGEGAALIAAIKQEIDALDDISMEAATYHERVADAWEKAAHTLSAKLDEARAERDQAIDNWLTGACHARHHQATHG